MHFTAKGDDSVSEPLITIKEFARRIGYSYKSALEVSRQKALIERRIAVRIRPELKKGGVRIDYAKYLEYLTANPAIPEKNYIQKCPRPERLKVIHVGESLLA